MDTISKEQRSKMMSKIRGKNTKPEVALRKLLYSSGFRYRIHPANLPGKPDIFLPKFKLAIFVNGCFWHGHTNCKIAHIPKSNSDFWKNKITRNRIRDAKNAMALRKQQIKPLIVWECQLAKHQEGILKQIIGIVSSQKITPKTP